METKAVKTIFFGSGSFAVKIFEGLLKLPFLDVTAVVTQPDKPAGRDKKLTPCPVMEAVLKRKYQGKVYQPVKLKDFAIKILDETQPEFILVADYGQIIPPSIIDYPKFKCLNVHGSLLPDLRGAVPAQMAILRGYTKTGVTIPVMTPGLDDGDIVAQQEIYIMPDDDTFTLRMHLAEVGNNLLKQILPLWFEGSIEAMPQDQSKATSTKQSDIAKEKAQITRETSMLHAERMTRAFRPWPVAWLEVKINGKVKRIKIYETSFTSTVSQTPFQIFKEYKKLYLALKDGVLELQKLQMEGKKLGNAEDYLYLDKSSINEP